MSGLGHDVILDSYRRACLDELEALKPGNVHVHADGHRMRVDDFVRSAEVSGPGLAARGTRVGERVLAGVRATIEGIGTNTNLGIILLCAPLAMAAERDGDLFAQLASVLADLDREDAVAAFEAIRIASPAGLGRVADHDVHTTPAVDLRTAMQAAAGHDRIARAYVTDYRDVLEVGLPALDEARRQARDPRWSTTAAYLAFLASIPDTHIQRKFGTREAESVQCQAAEIRSAISLTEGSCEVLLQFDRNLKARGINPGTSADFTVATLFADRLIRARECL